MNLENFCFIIIFQASQEQQNKRIFDNVLYIDDEFKLINRKLEIHNLPMIIKQILPFLLFLSTLTLLSAYRASVSNIKKANFTLSGCVQERPIYGQFVNEQDHVRSLATATPHPFKLFGEFPASTNTTLDITTLKKMFGICSQYYSRVIQVTDIGISNTVYDHANFGQCGTVVPVQYANGFDQNIKDAIIMNIIQDLPNASHIARASACIHTKWITYGYVKYNAPNIQTDLSKAGTFHNAVLIVMHEVAHVLGMSSTFYSRHFGTYSSTNFLSTSLVVQNIVDPIGASRYMIISPNVKSYVQNLFGCSNTSLGAYIEENGGTGSAGSHFQRKIFYDDMMTASDMSSGLKITPLVLYYFLDTGYFYSVDVTLSWDSYFGKGKGCNFLQGNYVAKQQFCSPSGVQGCDFYNVHGGYCSNGDPYSSGSYYMRAYSNVQCQLQQTVRASGPLYPYYTYRYDSRCFSIANFPNCYLSKCVSSGIEITISNITYLCTPTMATVNTTNGILQCPSDHTRFCSRNNCKDFCSTQGICIKGQCILIKCQIAIPGCLSCTVDTLNRCIQCITGYFPILNQTACKTCSTIIPSCSQCLFQSNQTKCSLCNQGYIYNSTTLNCQICATSTFPNVNKSACALCSVIISGCTNCYMSNFTTLCSSCNSSYSLSIDNKTCLSNGTLDCSIIIGCTNCQLVSGSATCLNCSSGLFIRNGRCYNSCSQAFPYCSICSNTSSCSSCIINYFIGTDLISCQPCSSFITNCQGCLNKTSCSSCSSGFYLNVNKSECSTCSSLFTNCTACGVDDSNLTVCKSCSNGLVATASGCTSCNQTITNCQICNQNGTAITCNTCSLGYFKSFDNTFCDICSNIISNCSSCSLNSTSNTVICSSCTAGLLTSPNKTACIGCSQAITNCMTCSKNNSIVSCYQCSSNFVSKDKLACLACSAIIVGCITCYNDNSTTKCQGCEPSLFPAIDSMSCILCSSIIKYCSQCVVVSRVTKCNACSSGLYPTINNNQCQQCAKIISNCYICQNSNGNISCVSCNLGYFLANNTCLLCSSPCKSCQLTAVNCTSCIDGFYLDGNASNCIQKSIQVGTYGGTCTSSGFSVACEKGCQACECSSLNQTICTVSMPGYTITSIGTTTQCQVGCIKCSADDSSNCTQCFPKYALQNFKCLGCHSSCATCNQTNPNICLTCPQAYQIGTNNLCSRCLITNCKQCDTSGLCVVCINGFSVAQGGNSCQQCLVSCTICSQTNIAQCLGCGYMQYLENNICNSCPQGCLQCNSSTFCSSCIDGYQKINSNVCYKNCQMPCLTCTNGVPNSCLSCLTGYVFDATKKTCSPIYNCGSSCPSCPIGSVLISGICQKCSDNACAKCNTNKTCLHCSIGYYLFYNSSCVQCPRSCSNCLNNNICLQCAEGYTKRQINIFSIFRTLYGQCIACQSPCKTCVYSPSRCQSCIENYTKKGWKCTPKTSTRFNITFSFDFNSFIQNNQFNAFKLWLINILGGYFSSNPQLFSGLTLYSGSTVVSAQIGNPSGSGMTQCEQKELLSSSLNQGSSFQGGTIISSSIQSSSSNLKCNIEQKQQQPKSWILGLILGLAIGIPVTVIIIVIIVICYRKWISNQQVINVGDLSAQMSSNDQGRRKLTIKPRDKKVLLNFAGDQSPQGVLDFQDEMFDEKDPQLE